MIGSFYTGLSGLAAYASALNIVGNNLANINTTAFKSSYISFHDLITATFGGTSTSASGNPMQVGLGILPTSVDGIFSQGSIQSTQEATNCALEGNGFFMVGKTAEDRFYTRAGNFSFNREGYLITPSGNYVLGYTDKDANGEIVTSGTLNTIFLPANIVSAPQASSYIQVFANLNANAADGDTFSSTVTVYDAKGASHNITIDFTYDATNAEWDYDITIPGADVVGGVVGTPFSLGTGTMEFDGTGTMIVPAGDVSVTTPVFTNGADALTFNWDLFDENGVPTFTGYELPSATNSTNADGYASGNLTSIIIDNEGVIQAVFSNGQVEDRARIAVANFNNPKGLLRMGQNLFAETNASGTAAIGSAGQGGRGTITSAALEASNVDIATEFTNMMIFERGYQANSRTVRTADEIIQEALSIKR